MKETSITPAAALTKKQCTGAKRRAAVMILSALIPSALSVNRITRGQDG